jgi:carboxypeptidase family protein
MKNKAEYCSWAASPIIALALLLTTQALTAEQEVMPGLIQGRVLDSHGLPIPDAQVRAFPKGDGPLSFREPFTQADANGNFLFKAVRPGVYVMHASKEEAGFPDSLWDFYGGSQKNEITVRSGATSTTTIHLAKAGTLTLRVLDTKTHKPVRAISLRMSRLHHHPNEFSTSPPGLNGLFSVLVPAAVPIEVEVLADGYEKWSYTKARPDQKFIKVESGASKPIQVALNPKP